MPLLIILSLPIFEILGAIWVADEIGYLNTAGLLCGAALVGIGLLSITGRTFLAELQLRAASGERLENVLLSQALRFIAGILFLIPGFITDGFALLALLASLVPGLIARPINRNMKRWNSQFVVFNSQSASRGPFRHQQQGWRDVTPEDPQVIDVSPEKPQSQD